MGELLREITEVNRRRDDAVIWILPAETLRPVAIELPGSEEPLEATREALRRYFAWQQLREVYTRHGIPVPTEETLAATKALVAEARKGVTPRLRNEAREQLSRMSGKPLPDLEDGDR